MAHKILYALYNVQGDQNVAEHAHTSREAIEELLLNRLDGLSSSVRSYLSLGALFGVTFDMSDVVDVMIRYHHIEETERTKFAATVGSGLQEAAEHGYLQTNVSTSTGDLSYTFSHPLWHEALTKQMLEEWKETMNRIIEEVLPHKVVKNQCDSSLTSETQSVVSCSTDCMSTDDPTKQPSSPYLESPSILGPRLEGNNDGDATEKVSNLPDEEPQFFTNEVSIPQTKRTMEQPTSKKPTNCQSSLISKPTLRVSKSISEADKMTKPVSTIKNTIEQNIDQKDGKKPATGEHGSEAVSHTSKTNTKVLPSRVQKTLQEQNQALAEDLKKILGNTDASHGGEEALRSLEELVVMLEG